MQATATSVTLDRTALLLAYQAVRESSVRMCVSLEPEEYRIQPMDDVSPPWWNLGHTSWFFARNVLAEFGGKRDLLDDEYDYLLNSYYASLGARLPRGKRGSITRPNTAEIYEYRQSVDLRIERLFETLDEDRLGDAAKIITIGIQHEQQHQELFYTEIKSILAQNPVPLRRSYQSERREATHAPSQAAQFIEFDGGLFDFGHAGDAWCWDNELPRHAYYLQPFAIQNRLITNGEYSEFVSDGGYSNQLLWLDNGWQTRTSESWQSPLYWERVDGQWQVWTLGGMQALKPAEPVCHLSFYEADAFARWKAETTLMMRDVRLPTEREWEHAAVSNSVNDDANCFLESGLLHPASDKAGADIHQMHGVLWQWTASYYEPYPGYRPFPGVLAEYNGKFMDNQRVLRGGSCVTPRSHYRHTYRNFWPASTRFQFTGVRLARDLT